MGIGAQMALHLFDDHRLPGGLNLYFDQAGLIDAQTVAFAELFDTLAAAAMGQPVNSTASIGLYRPHRHRQGHRHPDGTLRVG
jgi:hypothetical protein